jgi:HlyD family secretion protein
LPAFMAAHVRPNQNVTVDTRKGLVKGHVLRIGGSSSNETRSVIIGLDGPLPEGAGLDIPVDATIDIDKLENILYVGRPVHTMANGSASLFKIINDGRDAERVNVKFGRGAVETIEVLEGLKEGDQIILSDMSNWEKVDRIHLK